MNKKTELMREQIEDDLEELLFLIRSRNSDENIKNLKEELRDYIDNTTQKPLSFYKILQNMDSLKQKSMEVFGEPDDSHLQFKILNKFLNQYKRKMCLGKTTIKSGKKLQPHETDDIYLDYSYYESLRCEVKKTGYNPMRAMFEQRRKSRP